MVKEKQLIDTDFKTYLAAYIDHELTEYNKPVTREMITDAEDAYTSIYLEQ